MECRYCRWIIDATASLPLGKFFTRARRGSGHALATRRTATCIERDIAWFETEEEAVELARQCASAWITERDAGVAPGWRGAVQRRDHLLVTPRGLVPTCRLGVINCPYLCDPNDCCSIGIISRTNARLGPNIPQVFRRFHGRHTLAGRRLPGNRIVVEKGAIRDGRRCN